MTKVDKKIASSDTIIVSRPNGYFSTRNVIQTANQRRWMYTNIIEPANVVMASAIWFWRLSARSASFFMSAGCFGSIGVWMVMLPPLGLHGTEAPLKRGVKHPGSPSLQGKIAVM